MRSLLIFLFSCFVFSQEQLLPDIVYKQTQDISFTKTIKNKTKFNSYLTKSNSLIAIGDTLMFGDISYETSFTCLGKFASASWLGFRPFDKHFSGHIIVVEEIFAYHAGRGKKKDPLFIVVFGRDPDRNHKLNNRSGRSIVDIDSALEISEIKLSNEPMSKEEAISKLKESKEFLDLEIITQEEYDKLKQELVPVIKGP